CRPAVLGPDRTDQPLSLRRTAGRGAGRGHPVSGRVRRPDSHRDPEALRAADQPAHGQGTGGLLPAHRNAELRRRDHPGPCVADGEYRMNCSTSLQLDWRILGPADLDRIVDLHGRAIRGIGPDQVRPERPEFFAAQLDGGGKIIGACGMDGSLVAYGVLQNGPDPGTRPDLWLGWPGDARVQKLAGASVAETHRGRRLQCELIRRRIELAHPDAYLYATAAPS